MSSSEHKKKALIPSSFFDEKVDVESFWSKDEIVDYEDESIPMEQFILYKRSKKHPEKFIQVYITLYDYHLILSKSKEWFRDYKSLNLASTFCTVRRLPKLFDAYPSGIMLHYNQRACELYVKKGENMNKFLNLLKKFVVQTNFDETYRLIQKLGKGTYGEVYSIQNKVNGKKFAAKIFDLSSFKDVGTMKIALINEICIHKKIHNDYIIKLFEVYETPNQILMIIEYAEGERLMDYALRGALDEACCSEIMKQLLQAVSYLHDRGIIHRDIKLENIIVDLDSWHFMDSDSLKLKLIDFGLSTTTSNLGLFKKSGTPGYCAPEILKGEKYGVNVDIFSLGVVMYTIITGSSPFIGATRDAIINLNKKADLKFNHNIWTIVSSNCKDLIQQMLQPNPQKRISAKQALEHPWFQMKEVDNQPVAKTVKVSITPELMGLKSKESISIRKTSTFGDGFILTRGSTMKNQEGFFNKPESLAKMRTVSTPLIDQVRTKSKLFEDAQKYRSQSIKQISKDTIEDSHDHFKHLQTEGVSKPPIDLNQYAKKNTLAPPGYLTINPSHDGSFSSSKPTETSAARYRSQNFERESCEISERIEVDAEVGTVKVFSGLKLMLPKMKQQSIQIAPKTGVLIC